VDGTKDFRPLAGLYLVVRIALTTVGYIEYHSLRSLLRIIITMAASMFIATARPYYKKSHMKILESLMLALIGLLSLLILAYQYLLPSETYLLQPYLIITFASIPQLVLILYILYHPLR